ncbi:DUF4123 domain-containing protein [Achromobacter sp. UMC71]|uniref:DUF4123 domain-containing protein n=1 Tax=Achromobacter sp. UMC71 TaxID=1862320 RepID=UPI0016016AD9|nr:DUF4123 domain-containing protein [Achromobacter sp. UMC71]MBB1627866.1 hypothetical protein [Achromobacter sp. UMC71]
MLEDRDTWIDPASPAVGQALYDAAWNQPQPVERYVLLDAAFAPGLPARLARWIEAEDYCSLYAGRYEGEGLDQVAPYLLRLPWVPALRQPLCDRLMALARGKPMLSLLFSEATLEQLADHLRAQIEAVGADGRAYLLRLADTRALAALLDVLTAAQRQRLLAGISRWSYVDRSGELHSIEGGSPAAPGIVPAPYRIDADQQRQLQQRALPDAILRFVQLRAGLFGELACSPAAAHRLIDEGVQRLARRGVDHDALAYRHALTLLRRHGLLSPTHSALTPDASRLEPQS